MADAPHGPSGLTGHVSMTCLVGLPDCDDLACVCACHDECDTAPSDLINQEGTTP